MGGFVGLDLETVAASGFALGAEDRAFRYGDGLFETMVWQGEGAGVRFFADHCERLFAGMEALSLDRGGLEEGRLHEHLSEVVRANGQAGDSARIRLQVWRGGGGLYGPECRSPRILAVSSKIPGGVSNSPVRLSYSRKATLRRSPTSSYKTCNALPYVLAAVERQDREREGGGAGEGFDLVLRGEGCAPAECVASNLFWLEGGALVTPGLETGCVGGVMRRNVLRWAESFGLRSRLAFADDGSLERAESAFLTNASGLRPVAGLNDTDYRPFPYWEELHETLGLSAPFSPPDA